MASPKQKHDVRLYVVGTVESRNISGTIRTFAHSSDLGDERWARGMIPRMALPKGHRMWRWGVRLPRSLLIPYPSCRLRAGFQKPVQPCARSWWALEINLNLMSMSDRYWRASLGSRSTPGTLLRRYLVRRR